MPRPPRCPLFPYTTLFRSTLRYSVVAAVQTFWLAARAEGLGVGWVSILDPAAVCRELDLPSDWTLVAYLRSEEHTSELQSRENLVCRLLLEKKTHGTRCRY